MLTPSKQKRAEEAKLRAEAKAAARVEGSLAAQEAKDTKDSATARCLKGLQDEKEARMEAKARQAHAAKAKAQERDPRAAADEGEVARTNAAGTNERPARGHAKGKVADKDAHLPQNAASEDFRTAVDNFGAAIPKCTCMVRVIFYPACCATSCIFLMCVCVSSRAPSYACW